MATLTLIFALVGSQMAWSGRPWITRPRTTGLVVLRAVDDQSLLVALRFLQGCKLAVKECRRHEMIAPPLHAGSNEGLCASEIDEAHLGAASAQAVAINALQGRARDDRRDARAALLVDEAADRREPGPAVLVGQRCSAPHLLDIGRWMKTVGVAERPSEYPREALARGRLAATRNPHQQQDRRADHVFFGSWWPPKPLRMADRTFSAKV